MKRIVCVFLVIMGSYVGFSQETEEAKTWSVLNAHLGISGFDGLYNLKTPSFGMSYEIKPGQRFSFGGYLGYTAAEHFGDDFLDGAEDEISGFNFGLMANSHFTRSETMHIYFGLTMGYQTHFSSGGFLWEPHLGIRKYIADQIAIHGELGLGLALIKLGASYKL